MHHEALSSAGEGGFGGFSKSRSARKAKPLRQGRKTRILGRQSQCSPRAALTYNGTFHGIRNRYILSHRTLQTHVEGGMIEVWATLVWNRNVIGIVFAQS
jgi:hypothetical protein